MAKYLNIRKFCTTNGPGFGISVFFSGCRFHCDGCFNSNAWDFNVGKEFTQETIDEILEAADNDVIDHLSILGGEPLEPENRLAVLDLTAQFKKRFPQKTVWLWTGNRINEDWIMMNHQITCCLYYTDYIVDGTFKKDLFDPNLLYRGSSNQRIIRHEHKVYTNLTHSDIFYEVNEDLEKI